MNVTEIQICSNGTEGRITHVRLFITNPSRTDPYILKSSTGLDPGEIIKTYNDGDKFFRLRPQDREVTLVMGTNPNYGEAVTVGDLRDTLYRMISYNTTAIVWNSDSKLELRFMDQNVYLASLYGTIKHNESDLHSIAQSVQLTFECEYPFLRTNEYVDMTENWTPDEEDHVFNEISYPVQSTLTWNDTKSTAPSGFKCDITCVADTGNLIIWDTRNPTIYFFWTVYNFHENDVVYFSSEEDNKYMYMVTGPPDNEFVQLIALHYWGSIWPMLLPGENQFDFSEGWRVNNGEFRETYWGV